MDKLNAVFACRVTSAERELFRELGTRLQKKESEAVRLVVRETVKILREQEARSAARRSRRGGGNHANANP